MAAADLAIHKYFAHLRDPRRKGRKRHLLMDLVVIAICAVICGADTWPEVEAFARRRREWLKKFLALPHGVPSHDTFERVFARLNPHTFARCFRDWAWALQQALGVEHIAIDGKTLCGSRDKAAGLGPLQLVSAWATQNHLSLGQVAVAEGSNEITAIPRLLEMLDLSGALVSIDAIGCQKAIAQQIVEQGGDYVLTVKDNQEHLAEDIRACLAQAFETDFCGLDWDEYVSEEQGHGRREKRWYTVIHDPQGIRDRQAWAKLCTIGMCYSERTVDGKTTYETRYFIGSRKAGARAYGRVFRGHWRIENNLHWQMDVTFREDDSQVHQRRAAQNLAQLRRFALSLLKQHPGKGSVACKRLEAALDTDVLEEILQG